MKTKWGQRYYGSNQYQISGTYNGLQKPMDSCIYNQQLSCAQGALGEPQNSNNIYDIEAQKSSFNIFGKNRQNNINGFGLGIPGGQFQDNLLMSDWNVDNRNKNTRGASGNLFNINLQNMDESDIAFNSLEDDRKNCTQINNYDFGNLMTNKNRGQGDFTAHRQMANDLQYQMRQNTAENIDLLPISQTPQWNKNGHGKTQFTFGGDTVMVKDGEQLPGQSSPIKISDISQNKKNGPQEPLSNPAILPHAPPPPPNNPIVTPPALPPSAGPCCPAGSTPKIPAPPQLSHNKSCVTTHEPKAPIKLSPSKAPLDAPPSTCKLRSFNWNRVVLDTHGVLGHPGAVLNKELTGPDRAWAGVTDVLWNSVSEVQVTTVQQVIELFGEGGGKAAKDADNSAKAFKRKWFVDRTRNSIEIVKRKVTQLGKTEQDIIQAVMSMDQNYISKDKYTAFSVLETLSQSCPVDLCEGLIAESIKPDPNGLVEWSVAEQFILNLLDGQPYISMMIKIWLIFNKFDKEFERVCKLQKTALSAIEKILNEPKFRKVLGAILQYGNCLNAGNVKKGQADGFQMKDLHLTETMKDFNGKPILHHVCQALAKDDGDMTQFLGSFDEVYICAETTDVRGQLNKFKQECVDVQILQKTIVQMDKQNKLSTTKFGLSMKQFNAQIGPSIMVLDDNITELDTQLKMACDRLLIPAADEKRLSAQKFFHFFSQFFSKVQKNMPKVKNPDELLDEQNKKQRDSWQDHQNKNSPFKRSKSQNPGVKVASTFMNSRARALNNLDEIDKKPKRNAKKRHFNSKKLRDMKSKQEEQEDQEANQVKLIRITEKEESFEEPSRSKQGNYRHDFMSNQIAF